MITTPLTFIQEVRAELKRVVWPSREQITRLTLSVVVISIIVSAIIGAFDYLFTTITQYIIK